MSRINIITTCLFCIFTLVLNAQDFDKAKMDELFMRLEKHQQSMGSISVFQDGDAVYTNAIGFIDLASKKKADVNTKYRIGSISKTFTAAIILKLVEDKKLKLSSPLTRWFPKVKNSARINVERLLNHSSGIYNFTNTDEYLAYMTKTLTREELFDKILEFGSAFEPGEDSDYSNSNYVLLTMIAEKVTGKSYDVLIQEMICQPLDLKNTYVGDGISEAKNEANSFTKIKDWEAATETNMSIPLGAGAIVSTASDVNTFLHALFNNKILSEASVSKMMNIENGYGLGLFSIPYGDKKAYGHNGGIDGFQSMAYHFPEDNMTITYLSNGVIYPVNDIMLNTLGIYYGKGESLPEFLPVMKLAEADLEKYLGTYKSESLPISLVISNDGNQLIGQATGQQSFPLDAFDIHKFKFDQAGLKVHFDPDAKSLTLFQGGKQYEMKK